jgi:anti-anti-sigma factor
VIPEGEKLMEIKSKDQSGVTIVSITGSIDTLTAPGATEFLNGLIAGGKTRLVADFAGVDYTSSAGLRVLLAAVKETRSRGGDLYLAQVRPDVQKVLTLSGFTSIMKVFPDVDAAVAAYEQR